MLLRNTINESSREKQQQITRDSHGDAATATATSAAASCALWPLRNGAVVAIVVVVVVVRFVIGERGAL